MWALSTGRDAAAPMLPVSAVEPWRLPPLSSFSSTQPKLASEVEQWRETQARRPWLLLCWSIVALLSVLALLGSLLRP